MGVRADFGGTFGVVCDDVDGRWACPGVVVVDQPD